LIDKFSLDHVQKSGARFDERRLEWMNGAWIRRLALDDLFNLVAGYWPEEGKNSTDEYKKQVLELVQERLKFFSELPELTRFFFVDLPVNPELIDGHKQLKKLSREELVELLTQSRNRLSASDFSVEDLTERLNALLETTGQKPAVLFSLIRVATTQSPASPGLAETLAVLGRDTSLKRIDTQLDALR
jgi:glutamyl-tRNA synthetase